MRKPQTNHKHPKSNNTKYPQLRSLWVALFCDVLGYSLFLPLLPAFVQKFGATNIQLGLLLATNASFTLVFGPILGKLSDKFGRKPILIISQMGTFTGFMVFAFSINMNMLFISRAIDGIFGGTLPIVKAMIGDVVKPRDRSIQMTNVGVCHNISNLFGPALGGILSKNFGLIGPGLVASSLSLFSIIQVSIYLKESAPSKIGKVIWNEGSDAEISSEQKLSNNEHGVSKGESLSLFKNRSAIILLIQWGLHSVAFTSIIAGLPLFAYTKFMIDEQEIGLIFSIAGVFQLFIRYTFFYPMLKKIGDFKTGKIGLSLFVFSYFIIGFVVTPYQLIIVMLLNSYAASCTRGVLQGFMSRTVHPKILGKVMGIHSAIENVAQIIGPIMITAMLTYWNVNFFGITSSILSLFALLMIFMKLEFKYEKNQKIENDFD